MIKIVKMYTVICDGCGKDSNANSEYSCWSEADIAEELAAEDNWLKDGKAHYCPQCYHYDDNDNLILKPKITANDNWI